MRKINSSAYWRYFPCTMAQCARIILLSLWRKWAACSLRSGWSTATQIIYDLIFYLTPPPSLFVPLPPTGACRVQSVKAALLHSSSEPASPFHFELQQTLRHLRDSRQPSINRLAVPDLIQAQNHKCTLPERRLKRIQLHTDILAF